MKMLQIRRSADCRGHSRCHVPCDNPYLPMLPISLHSMCSFLSIRSPRTSKGVDARPPLFLHLLLHSTLCSPFCTRGPSEQSDDGVCQVTAECDDHVLTACLLVLDPRHETESARWHSGRTRGGPPREVKVREVGCSVHECYTCTIAPTNNCF